MGVSWLNTSRSPTKNTYEYSSRSVPAIGAWARACRNFATFVLEATLRPSDRLARYHIARRTFSYDHSIARVIRQHTERHTGDTSWDNTALPPTFRADTLDNGERRVQQTLSDASTSMFPPPFRVRVGTHSALGLVQRGALSLLSPVSNSRKQYNSSQSLKPADWGTSRPHLLT